MKSLWSAFPFIFNKTLPESVRAGRRPGLTQNIKPSWSNAHNTTYLQELTSAHSSLFSFPSTSSKPYKWHVTFDNFMQSLAALQSAAGRRIRSSLYSLSARRYDVSKKPLPNDISNPLCWVKEPQYHTDSWGNLKHRFTSLCFTHSNEKLKKTVTAM